MNDAAKNAASANTPAIATVNTPIATVTPAPVSASASMSASASASTLTPTPRFQAVALLVAGAFFMENLDGTIIATALPQMAESFGSNAVDLNVGMTAYLLTLAVFIPISGWVADRLGARTVFGWAIVVFTVASILCGLSNSLWMFTCARVLQGLGGAMMVPVGRLAVLRTTSKADLMRAIATITWPGLVAPIIGPPLGGFITTYFSWHWIFFLNVPLGILGIFLTFKLVPNERPAGRPPFDALGFVLTGVACCGTVYALDMIGAREVRWGVVVAWLIGSAACAVFAVRHLRRSKHPLLDLRALKTQTFRIVMAGGSLFRLSIGAVPFLLPLMFQVGFHLDAFSSGLLVLAVFAGNLAMKPATTTVLRRFGFRRVVLVNGFLAALSIMACGFFTPDSSRWAIAAVLFAGGLFRSMQFTALNTLSFADIPSPQMSGANTLSSTIGQMTMGLGVAFGAIALRLSSWRHPETNGELNVSDFRITFVVVGLIALAGLYDCFGLPKNAGAEVSGHRA